MTTIQQEKLAANYVGGQWVASDAAESVEVTNPATGENLASIALSGSEDVGKAVAAASADDELVA